MKRLFSLKVLPQELQRYLRWLYFPIFWILVNDGVSVKCLWENKIAKEGQPLLQ